jgi:LAGLIDADG endonuclease
MPALVGGFGNFNCSNVKYPLFYIFFKLENLNLFGRLITSFSSRTPNLLYSCQTLNKLNFSEVTNSSYSYYLSQGLNNQLGPYLAGLIEGDGTFAIHDKESTAKKYAPMIIIVFKKSDFPFANYLRDLTNCGKVYNKPERGYIIWQIQDIISVYGIVKIINGYMRTPKIEALDRTISWINNYIDVNENSKLPRTQHNLSSLSKLETCSLDSSKIESNS